MGTSFDAVLDVDDRVEFDGDRAGRAAGALLAAAGSIPWPEISGCELELLKELSEFLEVSVAVVGLFADVKAGIAAGTLGTTAGVAGELLLAGEGGLRTEGSSTGESADLVADAASLKCTCWSPGTSVWFPCTAGASSALFATYAM